MGKKIVLAKLYNFKSYVEGKIQELQADMVMPEQAVDHVAAMLSKTIEALAKNSDDVG